ncbi:hypothetical protein [Spirulina sp. 06S082]|uniref:hypothetical protein n=1 Tax=Spirulina sp. 06S082 TaxID=3110248 RepID=UPI002B21B06E|nr:hypothetical protein [Spirulina sp. 06S082]
MAIGVMRPLKAFGDKVLDLTPDRFANFAIVGDRFVDHIPSSADIFIAIQKAIEIAKELLDILDEEMISQKTGLSLEEVQKLKQEIVVKYDKIFGD